MKTLKVLNALLCGIGFAYASQVSAEKFPSKEVQVVVNYGAGGVTDVATRLLAKALEKQIGTSVVVVNKPGGQATLGPAFVARQKPDGYTLGVITYSAIAITPHLIDVPYTAKDFDFIGGFGRYRYGFAVQADSPYHSVKDFVEAAKRSDKPLFFGVPGAPNNIAFFELASASGAKLEQVLYKSGTESVSAVAAKQVDATIQTPSEIKPFVESGKVRLLASVSPDRWHDRPDMPTMGEAGYNIKIESWLGLALPAGTPTAIRARLEAALKAAAEDADLVASLSNMGIDPVWLSGNSYAKKLSQGYKEMRPLLEQTGQPLIAEKTVR
ncbi:tripartite tricarboxylate transporter substrate binding protein [Pusillimonas sp. TS35]|uniref:tripartite tricarboxylate transporter substrate binding protein n=1 Tax=Paracandidimonas lactea TaxID=2895524 RepID=UPI00136C2CD2|nr:tripartite tricarboxylate transporter substrate binding protein [Paracandidimonas lactea]MYN13930.1 tripartite tricarboxylate transporter substrate binding protein [Pusillimonas sp. TS35]